MTKIKLAFRFLFEKLILIVKFIAKLIKNFFRFVHRRKRYAIPFYSFVSYVLLVILLVKISGDPNYTKELVNKRINDITALNPIQVGKIIKPHSADEIIEAVKSTTGPISIGGGKFSMGGQTAYENSLHIDMREFNKVLALDTIQKQITVQSGIIWRDVQKVIDPHNLSVKIMQTYANFTVGGSLSVNCHGRYIGHGPIISSVLEIKLVTSSGEIITASRTQNSEIFSAAIGGYGGIGVIVQATLQLVDNVKVERQTALVPVADYNDFFDKNIRNDKDVIFQNGDLYPPNFDVIRNVAYKKTDKELTDTDRIRPEGENYWPERQVMKVVSSGGFGKWIRRKLVDPVNYSFDKVTWRNKEASYDVHELEPASRENQTYVLEEYFIPVKNIKSFIPKMKAVYDKYNVNVINVSLRHAYANNESYLSWARGEVFAFVIYYKQGTDKQSRETVKQWTVEMTDAILSENGTWYLPYQPHATIAQFEKGYPNANKYFEVKNRLDSSHRFINKLIDKYDPYLNQTVEKERASIMGYYRDEGQTILTVPEWYLVFNPKEYADYLEAGNNPSNFPFYASLNEYWKLYDRSMKLASTAYPPNEEYSTMLKVIGVSITMEYAAKIIYENTVGKFFGLFANNMMSAEEKTIVQAQRAYSDLIYDKAWYEFKFMPWVKKVWSVSDTSNSSFLRKWERKFFFTLEFTFKAGYAELIEWAAKASYDEPVKDIYLLTSGKSVGENVNIRVIKEKGGKGIIAVPRWGEFTKTILSLSDKDLVIQEISGNDEIVVSVLMDNNAQINFKNADLLYESSIVSNAKLKRQVYLVPVGQLLPFIWYAKENKLATEHIYDY